MCIYDPCLYVLSKCYLFFYFLAQTVPGFVAGLKPMVATQGRTARFEVEVSGNPSPNITWYLFA